MKNTAALQELGPIQTHMTQKPMPVLRVEVGARALRVLIKKMRLDEKGSCSNTSATKRRVEISPHTTSISESPTAFLSARTTHAHQLTNFNPQHWLLCQMGLYKFEFEFKRAA
jgi:hypothetical protein